MLHVSETETRTSQGINQSPSSQAQISHPFQEYSEQYRIIDIESYNENGQHGIRCKTPQGEWVIFTQNLDQKLTPQEDTYVLNGAGKTLYLRQWHVEAFNRKSKEQRDIKKHPKHIVQDQQRQARKKDPPREAIEHEDNVHFFRVNWDVLSTIFYTEDREHAEGLQTFTEVDLNDLAIRSTLPKKKGSHKNTDTDTPTSSCGRADFVGVGYDGQIVIVEFGRKQKGKSAQVIRHARGLEYVITTKNHIEEQPQISPFIGIYEVGTKYRTVTLQPPSPLPHNAVEKNGTVFELCPRTKTTEAV